MVGVGEDLDEILADFFPQPVGPFGTPLYSGTPLPGLAGLIERHHLKPDAEHAAKGHDGIQARPGSSAHVADGFGAAGGEQRKAAIGDAGVVDELQEALFQVGIWIESAHVFSPSCTLARPRLAGRTRHGGNCRTLFVPGYLIFRRVNLSA